MIKILLVLSLGVSLSLAQEEPSKRPIERDTFGRMEGILAYCAKIDAQSEAKYRERSKLLTHDQADKDVEEARKSKEYQEALRSISEQLDKGEAKNEALQSCQAFLAGK